MMEQLIKYLNYYLVTCIVTICFCLAPLFISDLQPRIQEISVSGILGDVLRTSVTIKVMAGISIGSTLPVMVDILLDKVANISFVDLTNTFIVLSVIIVFGTLYLSLNDKYYMTYLYVTFFYMVMIITTSSVLYSVSRGVVATQWKMNSLWFLMPLMAIAGILIFVVLLLLFPGYYAFGLLLSIFRGAMIISTILVHGRWFSYLWRHYKTHQRFGVEEMKETTYMVGLFFFFGFLGIFIRASSNNIIHFLNTDERFLIFYYVILILCCLILTVLPGRLLRKLSEIQESVLRMKREFVRYLSHEIRSPLNVSHAGLEILKAELETMGASLAILALVDDIFSASNAAIEILNDTLHYEHLESGTFKLELAVTPLQGVFVGRLEPYKFMASKKGIILRIEDLVQASEYYAGSAADAMVDAELGVVPSTGGADRSTSPILVLYIDRFRVEQIVRNLMSNAIKFTPEGGNIAIRLTRIAATNLPTVGHPSHQEPNPIEKLEDEYLNKTVAGYLRFEVVDSGAGSMRSN